MKARERLWLTADKQRLVGEGHLKAATLYAAVGDEIPEEMAERFGLVDGGLKGAKERKPADNKENKGGEDKSSGKDKQVAPGAAGGGEPKPAKTGGLTVNKRPKG